MQSMQNEMFSKLKVRYIVKSANDDIVNSRELYCKVLQTAMSQCLGIYMSQCLKIAMSKNLGLAMSQSLGIAISQIPDDGSITKSK